MATARRSTSRPSKASPTSSSHAGEDLSKRFAAADKDGNGQLTVEEAKAESPLHRLDHATKPVIVTYGTGELPELQRQSQDYFMAREKLGLPGCLLPLAGKDHFTILAELADPEGALALRLPGIFSSDAPIE